MRLRTRLLLSYGALGLLLVVNMATTIWQTQRRSERFERVTELRVPAAQASLEMLSGVNDSLAALRGWILLGSPEFKQGRATAWAEGIEPSLAKLKGLGADWSDQEDRERLAAIERRLAELKAFQEEIEDIAQAPRNTPASKILFEEAVPKAKILGEQITRMIDIESTLAATPERKRVLGAMADVRGTLGLGLGAIRAYLLSGDERFKRQFATLWAENTKRFRDLSAQVGLLTPEQRKAYEVFAEARRLFDLFPDKMFKIRGAADWNLANSWLGTRAAPTASAIRDDLDALIASQRRLMAVDLAESREQTEFFIRVEWFLVGVGAFLCAFLAWSTTRSVLRQVGGEPAAIARVTAQIAKGDLDIEFEGGTGVRASVGTMLLALRESRDETRLQDWLKTGVAQLEVVLRGDPSLDTLAARAVSEIATYLNAQVGAIYVLQDGEPPQLSLLGGYAHLEREDPPRRFRLGEGLVGQAAQEQQQILVRDVPRAYFKVMSGLGEHTPRAICVTPFLSEGSVRGVVEIGTLGELTGGQTQYLALAMPALGIAVASAQARTQLAKSLEQSQLLLEEVQVQQEELRATNDELEEQTAGFSEAHERLQSILNTAVDGIITIDPRGHIRSVNRAAEAMFGYPAEEILGRNVKLLMPQPYKGEHDGYLARYLETGEAKIMGKSREVEGLRRDGSVFPLRLGVGKMEFGGELLFTGIVADITEQRGRDEELKRAQADAEAANQAKSEFLANMSHELRTPLNSLLILSKALADNEEGNLSEDQVESARIIYGSGAGLLSLINEILDLSKIEAGHIDLELSNVPLADLAESTRRSFKHVAKQKGLVLDVRLTPDAPSSMFSDQQRIEQIIRNLVSNAIKFTEQGEVIVELGRPREGARLTTSGLDPASALAISVSDTGIGIPLDKQALVFEAFRQAEGGTARKHGGTGLGLSISLELAALLGGEIQLVSEPGEGATFTLYLPLEQGDAGDAHGTHRMTVRRLGGKLDDRTEGPVEGVPSIPDDRKTLQEGDTTILIIEDDATFARVLRDQCHKRGYKCLAAATGEEGLGLADGLLPQAILLDLRLPGIDGWVVLDVLKSKLKTRHIPVYVVSAVPDASGDVLRKGALGCLPKPASLERVHQALDVLETSFRKGVKELLLVEDDDTLRAAMTELIGNGDVHVEAAETGASAIAKLERKRYDCMILDLGLPDMSGFTLLEKLSAIEGLVIPPVVVYTGRDLTRAEQTQLQIHAESIIIKGVRSEERLLDEVCLFLHRVIGNLPLQRRRIFVDLYEGDTVLAGKRVLIVDDDMRNSFALSKALERRGMKTTKAEDGEKALAILASDPSFDLVLMDIMMPVMDGYETMKRIRAQAAFKELPIIALTAKAMRADRARCLAAGASDYLSKPIDVDRLLSILRVRLYESS